MAVVIVSMSTKRKSSWVIGNINNLLRCQSENCQFPLISNPDRIVSKYWNRDDVSTLNIRSIVRETIATIDRERRLGVRPFRFRRGT